MPQAKIVAISHKRSSGDISPGVSMPDHRMRVPSVRESEAVNNKPLLDTYAVGEDVGPDDQKEGVS